MNGNTIRTFLGANSGHGFSSLYPSFPGESRTLIIKGGPGSGKSGVLKKIAAKALKEQCFVEYCYCSSDADSLDDICIPGKSLCAVDVTSPHLMEPRFAGAQDDIFYTGQFWDRQKLKRSFGEIRDLTLQIKECFARAYRYLASAEKTAEDIRAIAIKKTSRKKLEPFAFNLARRHIKQSKGTTTLLPRFLSSFSPQGYVVHRDTVYTMAEKVFVLEDSFRISHLFLESVMNAVEDCGQSIYLFYDPLCPDKLQHLVFPESSVAFVTSNKTCRFEPQKAYRIHLNRFTDLSNEEKLRCKTAESLIEACIKEALSSLKQEKAFHDDLEEFYVEAMDFKALNL
ncbi:MAG: hypothetical protein II348_03980, partial [Clostridia bacterium]|nr:hypothetical protein [Clostridia bacterium]